MPNYNILSLRYATDAMNNIFSEETKNLYERDLWLEILKAEKDLGIDIPQEAVDLYESVKEDIDLERIREIEVILRHDVKAKIQAYNEAAGGKYELIHRPMTSKDLTDNVEQKQILDASKIILGKYVSVLRHLKEKSLEYKHVIPARTHHQAAQPTTLGRRMAMYAEELYYHLKDFEDFIDNYPMRGIKGPVGTQLDILSLLGEEEKVKELEKRIAEYMGFSKTLSSTGQVYPRSLDYKLASRLALLSAPCESFATTLRLMAGLGWATEGFKEGQVGSSAMPHKMNSRSSERIYSFSSLLKMYSTGASFISGGQWEEGDVSESALRRVIIPDIFYTSDGLCETMLTILNEMGVYPESIEAEMEKYMPFLATTELLTAATEKGRGREEMHEIIKKHAVDEALRMRETGSHENRLVSRLKNEGEFPLSEEEIEKILEDRKKFLGRAEGQINEVVEKVDEFIERYPKQAAYEPGEIL